MFYSLQRSPPQRLIHHHLNEVEVVMRCVRGLRLVPVAFAAQSSVTREPSRRAIADPAFIHPSCSPLRLYARVLFSRKLSVTRLPAHGRSHRIGPGKVLLLPVCHRLSQDAPAREIHLSAVHSLDSVFSVCHPLDSVCAFLDAQCWRGGPGSLSNQAVGSLKCRLGSA